MRILFAGDHAGFELKRELMAFVKTLGHEVEDCGPLSFDKTDDYPDFVIPMAKKVAGKPSTEVRGVVAAGSGQGEVIAANRVAGVRAVVYYGNNPSMVKVSRDHNDSNVITIGTRFVTLEDAKEAVRLWLETPFSNDERHVRRLQKIEALGLRL
ncbi:MAG: RpiB/LacA/LacB family sugar-phosphate isomerase [bacterium]|nr:RpiB/LacA/LacB family sugar-phosphate isomerase [bacterium]